MTTPTLELVNQYEPLRHDWCDAVIDLTRRGFSAHAGSGAAQGPSDVELLADIANPTVLKTVVLSGGVPIGLMTTHTEPASVPWVDAGYLAAAVREHASLLYVATVVVDPAVLRTGAAQQLVAGGERFALDASPSGIVVHVDYGYVNRQVIPAFLDATHAFLKREESGALDVNILSQRSMTWLRVDARAAAAGAVQLVADPHAKLPESVNLCTHHPGAVHVSDAADDAWTANAVAVGQDVTAHVVVRPGAAPIDFGTLDRPAAVLVGFEHVESGELRRQVLARGGEVALERSVGDVVFAVADCALPGNGEVLERQEFRCFEIRPLAVSGVSALDPGVIGREGRV